MLWPADFTGPHQRDSVLCGQSSVPQSPPAANMAAAQPQAAAVAEAEAVVEVVEAMSVINGAQPALDLSDEIKEASFYVLLRALLDAASMLGSVNVVELAMWARWKMKYDTPQLAFSGLFLIFIGLEGGFTALLRRTTFACVAKRGFRRAAALAQRVQCGV